MSLAPFNQDAINAVITIFVTFPEYKELICCKRLNKAWLNQINRPSTWNHITVSPDPDFSYFAFRLAAKKAEIIEHIFKSSPFMTQLKFDGGIQTQFRNLKPYSVRIDLTKFIYLRKLILSQLNDGGEINIVSLTYIPRLEYLKYENSELAVMLRQIMFHERTNTIKIIEFYQVRFTGPYIYDLILHLSYSIEELIFIESDIPKDICRVVQDQKNCRKLVMRNMQKNDDALTSMIFGDVLKHLELTQYHNHIPGWNFLLPGTTPNLTYLNISKTNTFFIDDQRLEHLICKLENLEVLVNMYEFNYAIRGQSWTYTCDMFGDPIRLYKRKNPLLYFTTNTIKACKAIGSILIFRQTFDEAIKKILDGNIEPITSNETSWRLHQEYENAIPLQVRDVLFIEHSSLILYRWGNDYDIEKINKVKLEIRNSEYDYSIDKENIYNYIGGLINTVATRKSTESTVLESGYDDNNNDNCTCEYL